MRGTGTNQSLVIFLCPTVFPTDTDVEPEAPGVFFIRNEINCGTNSEGIFLGCNSYQTTQASVERLRMLFNFEGSVVSKSNP